MPNMIDRMMRVPDAQSLAGMRVLSRLLGRKVGGSTGTNFVALCILTSRMKSEGRKGSLVSLICDGGERYGHTYYNDDGSRRRASTSPPTNGRWRRSSRTAKRSSRLTEGARRRLLTGGATGRDGIASSVSG